jgi:hypothetical protein
MSWFYEDQRLGESALRVPSRGFGDSSISYDETAVVAVDDLVSGDAGDLPAGRSHAAAASQNWARFMNHVFRAFRETRGPLTKTSTDENEGAEEDENIEDDSDYDDPEIERSLSVFDKLFELLLSSEGKSRNAMVAFDLTQYVCERLRPDVTRVKTWVERLIKALLKTGVPPERRDDVASAILLMLGIWLEPGGYRWARDCLLRMNVDFAGDIPSTDGVKGFQSVLPQNLVLAQSWTELRRIRTYPEQVRTYLLALESGKPSSEYGDLAKEAREEWPTLEEAFTSDVARRRVLELRRWQESCPRCHMSLPTSEVFKLQSFCVATATNCCRRVIVWTGD